MAKTGMKKYVLDHRDPTYEQALGHIRKEEKAWRECMKRQVQQRVHEFGYELEAITIRNPRTGTVFKV